MAKLSRSIEAKKTAATDHDRDLDPVLRSLLRSIDHHDAHTGSHSRRVRHLATTLARAMRLPPAEVETVDWAAQVHDVGKLHIPAPILQKKGSLTDEEFDLMREHPARGADIIPGIAGMEALRPIVLHHHERWDGAGYPDGLAGEDIPLAARIIFIVDAFDAMTSYRPYGDVLSTEEALAEIRRNAGTQFDPLVAGLMQGAVGAMRASLGAVPIAARL